MPFIETDVNKKIATLCERDPLFKKAWEDSQEEYRIVGEIVEIRKHSGISQYEIASATGMRQQAISRLEKHQNSPTLRTVCNILSKLGYKLNITPEGDNSNCLEQAQDKIEERKKTITGKIRIPVEIKNDIYIELEKRAVSTHISVGQYAGEIINSLVACRDNSFHTINKIMYRSDISSETKFKSSISSASEVAKTFGQYEMSGISQTIYNTMYDTKKAS